MPLHGSFGELYIDDTSAACQQLGGDITTVTANFGKNNPESTAFQDHTVQRIDGLRDFTLDATAIFEHSASAAVDKIVGMMENMYSTSDVRRVQYFPGGSTTGCPVYTASMRLNSLAINHPVDGIITLNFSMAIASGSVTIGDVA